MAAAGATASAASRVAWHAVAASTDVETVSAGYDAFDGSAAFRMFGQGIVHHALLDFETLWLFIARIWNRLVYVGGHGFLLKVKVEG